MLKHSGFRRTMRMISNRTMLFAGSAKKQGPNVGRIDRWSEWRPTTAEPLWLLLSGATDPPSSIEISKRRTRDAPGDRSGAFLAGVSRDLVNMEDVVGANLFNSVKDLYFTKSAALGHISRLFDKCKGREAKRKRQRAHPMLYYTGHGEIGTGDWCFDDGTISIQEIFEIVPEGCHYPIIFSDTCYSGHWADFCTRKGIEGFHCLAACPHYSKAVDTPGKGGDLTLFMTGKKLRPKTEPMYSGGTYIDFPRTPGFSSYPYSAFVRGNIKGTQRILISQSMHDKYFSACFATSELYSPKPAVTWWNSKTYDTFELFKNKTSKNIVSLSCDEKFGFGAFFMEGFGTSQSIVTDMYRTNIKKNWDEGFSITACAARGSTFYIVMTKETKEYKGKSQVWFTRSTWNEVNAEIQKGYQNGKAVTAICYSTGLRRYFFVLTVSSAEQCYERHNGTKEGHVAQIKWVRDKHQEGFYPTVIFHDPNDDKILVVMTTDKNISDFECNFRNQMI